MYHTREDYTLADLGLPADYNSLTDKGKKLARFSCLTGWYDPASGNEVCSDVEGFVKATRLMVEYYLKPAPCNKSRYYFKDPACKYDMVRAIMAPAKIATEPAKTLVQATRGFTKTETVIHQAALTAAITRPDTGILLTEFNDTRTREEIKKLKRQIEDNEIIHRDFGGKGLLFPKNKQGRLSWSDRHIEFCNGSYFLGASLGAAIRGRHPQIGIIDDPEKDKKKSRNPEWRREYFEWLFNSYMGQFTWGNKIIWIGTPVDERSCLQLALRGVNDESLDDKDARFEDWEKVKLQIIQEDAVTGERYSLFPDLVSVEAFDAKVKTMGRAAAMAELMGDPIVDGEEVFDRDIYRHGYMKCVEKDVNGRENYYFLDLKNGRREPWDRWLESLSIVGANDIADSTSPDSDPATSVFVGVDENGIVYVLDVWGERCLVDKHVPKAFGLASKWNARKMGWEKSAMQSVVVRWTKELTKELREDGKCPPAHVAVPNNISTGSKEMRIIGALTPLMAKYQIRFLHTEPVQTADGIVHEPAKCAHKRFHRILKDTIDTFTDNGPSGFIDYPDALEMAVRIAGGTKGRGIVKDEKDIEDDLKDWEKAGLDFGSMIPIDKWTDKMHRERSKKFEEELAITTSDLSEFDPYG